MTSNKLTAYVGALVFLILAGLCLYRLLFGFEITIGGMMIGNTISFFGLVVFVALALMLFRGGAGASRQ